MSNNWIKNIKFNYETSYGGMGGPLMTTAGGNFFNVPRSLAYTMSSTTPPVSKYKEGQKVNVIYKPGDGHMEVGTISMVGPLRTTDDGNGNFWCVSLDSGIITVFDELDLDKWNAGLLPNKAKVCTCGSAKVNSVHHSSWCDIA